MFLGALEKPDIVLLQSGSPFAQDFFEDQESSSHSRSVCHQPPFTNLRWFVSIHFALYENSHLCSLSAPQQMKKPPRSAVSIESSLQYFYLYCCSSHTAVWTRPRFLQALRKSSTKGNQNAVNCDLTELEDTAPWGRISQLRSLPLSKGECPAPFEK